MNDNKPKPLKDWKDCTPQQILRDVEILVKLFNNGDFEAAKDLLPHKGTITLKQILGSDQ